jgi:hypothetical protein
MEDQDDSPPAFTWSKSDIPSICIAFDCDELVPANIPQKLSNLFCECAKLLYYSPSGSSSIDLLKTHICINLGISRLEDHARQNTKGHRYPEINFRALLQRVLDMECNINLVVSDTVAWLDCIVWEYLLNELEGAQFFLLSLEKGKKVVVEIQKAARAG